MQSIVKTIRGIRIPDFLILDTTRKSKISSEERKKAYQFLTLLYLEQCALCGKNRKQNNNKEFDIDHIDEKPFHHYWKNLQLLCHSCNCKKRSKNKNKRKGRIKVGVSENIKDMKGDTKLRNIYLIQFLNYIESEFQDRIIYNYNDLITDASLVCGFCSEETIKRYMRQLCSNKLGIFEKIHEERNNTDYIKLVGRLENLRKIISW